MRYSDRVARRFDFGRFRITRGALIIAGLEVVMSILWLVLGRAERQELYPWLAATPTTVFHEGHVWTLATSVFVEPQFLTLLLGLLLLWSFIPTLERFWGTTRFFRFFAITSLAGTIAGTLAGLALGRDEPIFGISPFVFAAIVAFGIVYAKQPVQFSYFLKMTGRQLMYGFLGFITLLVVLQEQWTTGAAYAGAILAAVILVSKRVNPRLMWKRWQLARAKAKLGVIDGGRARPRKRDDYVN